MLRGCPIDPPRLFLHEVLAFARMTIYGGDAFGDDGVMGTFAYPGQRRRDGDCASVPGNLPQVGGPDMFGRPPL